jgi:hypothetical protein
MQLNAVDGLGQPIEPGVSIHRAGSEERLTYSYGGRFIDLPPGEYDIFYHYTPAIEFKNVRVDEGQVTTKTASGYGRATFDMVNGNGEKVEAGVSIFRGESEERLTYTYGGRFIDLPPGGYVAVHRRGDEDVKTPFAVSAGSNTTVALRAD